MEAREILAVDLALVLPEAAQERARSINASLADFPNGFRFDRTHVPHISLFQQFVRQAELPALIDALDAILSNCLPLHISVTGIEESPSRVVSYIVERTPELLELHERLMATGQFSEVAGTAAAFFSSGELARAEPARPEDVRWVAEYREHAAYARFHPHITLGRGQGASFSPATDPFSFRADRAALFHLGRFCTCQRLLHDWSPSAASPKFVKKFRHLFEPSQSTCPRALPVGVIIPRSGRVAMRAFGLLGLLAAVAIGLFIYRSQLTGPGDVTQGTGNVRAAADTTGVKGDLLAMAQAERAHMALSGHYAPLDELHSSGDLTLDPAHGRAGYTYSAETGDRTFTITATYSGPAAMPNFSINENMEMSRQ